jgi:hypothetical protein
MRPTMSRGSPKASLLRAGWVGDTTALPGTVSGPMDAPDELGEATQRAVPHAPGSAPWSKPAIHPRGHHSFDPATPASSLP